MTAPYRDPDPVRSGETLRGLECHQRIVTGEEWTAFDWLPTPTPPDEEPTLVVDWASVRSLTLPEQARASRPAVALVRWPSTDGPMPYQSRVTRRHRPSSPLLFLRAACLCITVGVVVLAWRTPDPWMALAGLTAVAGTWLAWA